jgi:hypothetical protein
LFHVRVRRLIIFLTKPVFDEERFLSADTQASPKGEAEYDEV